MDSSATAIWQGSGKDGTGNLTTESSVLDNAPYSFDSRFESGSGTNPEELIAAAHAGCFNMKLSFVLGNSGIIPEQLETKCVVTMDDGVITSSKLILKAKIDGVDEKLLQESIKDAEENCPISVLYNTKILVEYTLL